jgi:hypothetical protein
MGDVRYQAGQARNCLRVESVARQSERGPLLVWLITANNEVLAGRESRLSIVWH